MGDTETLSGRGRGEETGLCDTPFNSTGSSRLGKHSSCATSSRTIATASAVVQQMRINPGRTRNVVSLQSSGSERDAVSRGLVMNRARSRLVDSVARDPSLS